jgi:hypothetical protein
VRRRPGFRAPPLGVLLAVLAAALAACGAGIGPFAPQLTHGPSAEPGALGRDAAVAQAIRLAPESSRAPSVVWASVEPDPFGPFDGSSPRRLVWEVRLAGGFLASPCPEGFLERPPSPSDAPCLDIEAGIVVVLDEFSGALIGYAH